MSIRQPKPKQIRLPFDVPRPRKGAEAPARVCGICRKQDSRYTCPRCNVAYCSLACFQDPKHAQCSEPFYRATVADAIAADPDAEMAEKRKMLDMLRRFESAAAEGEDSLRALEAEWDGADDGDDDEAALAAALDGVDLDTIDSNDLFRLLPAAHRDAFLAAMRDPDSAAARELLDAAGGDDGDEDDAPAPMVLPWWEGGVGGDSDELPHAAEPEPIASDVLDAIHPPPGVGVKLAYNMMAVCLAYVHVLLSHRLPSLSTSDLGHARVSAQDIRTELLALCPFLAPRSTARYESARAAWGGVWEAIGAAGDQAPPQDALPRLLDTVAQLFRPPITTDPPRAALLLADVYRLLSAPSVGAEAKKVAFYVAAMRGVQRPEWLRIAGEVAKEAERVRDELREDEREEEKLGQSLLL